MTLAIVQSLAPLNDLAYNGESDFLVLSGFRGICNDTIRCGQSNPKMARENSAYFARAYQLLLVVHAVLIYLFYFPVGKRSLFFCSSSKNKVYMYGTRHRQQRVFYIL